MNLHLAPGELNEDAPAVWGHLRFNATAGLWFIDWYSAKGQLEGATMANAEEYRWAESHPEELAAQWEQIKVWQTGLWRTKNSRPNDPIDPDDPIPF